MRPKQKRFKATCTHYGSIEKRTQVRACCVNASHVYNNNHSCDADPLDASWMESIFPQKDASKRSAWMGTLHAHGYLRWPDLAGLDRARWKRIGLPIRVSQVMELAVAVHASGGAGLGVADAESGRATKRARTAAPGPFARTKEVKHERHGGDSMVVHTQISPPASLAVRTSRWKKAGS